MPLRASSGSRANVSRFLAPGVSRANLTSYPVRRIVPDGDRELSGARHLLKRISPPVKAGGARCLSGLAVDLLEGEIMARSSTRRPRRLLIGSAVAATALA